MSDEVNQIRWFKGVIVYLSHRKKGKLIVKKNIAPCSLLYQCVKISGKWVSQCSDGIRADGRGRVCCSVHIRLQNVACLGDYVVNVFVVSLLT